MSLLVFCANAALLLGTLYGRLMGARFRLTGQALDTVLDPALAMLLLGSLAYLGGDALRRAVSDRGWSAVVKCGLAVGAAITLVAAISGRMSALHGILTIWTPFVGAGFVLAQLVVIASGVRKVVDLQAPPRWRVWLATAVGIGLLLFLVRGALSSWAPWFRGAYVVELALVVAVPMLGLGLAVQDSKWPALLLAAFAAGITLLL